MKSLQQILEERILQKDNIFVWNYAQFDEWDESKVLNELKEQLIKFQHECIITMIDVYNDEINNKYPEKLRNAAIKASKEYKSFSKLNDEKKEQWILKKIEEIKKNAEYLTKDHGRLRHLVKKTAKVPLIVPPTKIDVETIGIDNFNIHIHNDIYTNSSTQLIKWNSTDIDKLAKQVFDTFPKDDEFKEHFRGFAIYTNQKNISSFDAINITFMFDDEFESKLEKSTKKFADFMADEYNSGRYMGD